MEYRTLDPATGKTIETYSLHSSGDVDRAVARAVEAFGDWRQRSVAERAQVLEAVAKRLEERASAHAETMALEMGKPLSQGEGEAEKCAWVCRYYAENGEEFLRPRDHESDGSAAWVRYDPLGPIVAVMPWNFPFWQVFRFAAPTLVAGNVVLLKHAPNTPRCALEIEELLQGAGGPPGLLQSLFLSNEEAGRLMERAEVRGVTLTGSSRAGRAVAQAAGRGLKPSVLELGGSDPFIVLDDADLDEAVSVGVSSRCLNSGQSCIAAKRFLVHRDVLDRFTDAFTERMAAQKVGDPREEGTDIGPLAREDLRDGLARQVEESVRAGARILTGGEPLEGDGFFYRPTVLTDVPDETPAAREELFGPVAVVLPFSSEAEMLEIANSTPYGLGASLWTGSEERAQRLIPEIESGSVFVNGLVKSDPRLPFGGVKESGYGRELARVGLLEFVNQKTVWIR